MSLELEEMTGKIIEAAIEVHKVLGPGFVEPIYENALALGFEERGIPFKRQLEILTSHSPPLITKAIKKRHGLSLNFAKSTLEIKRVILKE